MNHQGLIALAGLLALPATGIPQCPGRPAADGRAADRGERTVELFERTVAFRHAATSQELLAVAWRYPRARGRAPLPRDQALALLRARDDHRPLLVLRECSSCQGTEQALLDARKNNDRTRLLCRWFNCIKLPPEVADRDHPLRDLFDRDDPAHLFLCDADGTARRDFDGRQTQGQLQQAMIQLVRRRYDGRPEPLVSAMIGRLAQLDKLDESIDVQVRRAQRESTKSAPDPAMQAQIEARLAALRAQRDEALKGARQLCDLPVRPLRRAPPAAPTPAAADKPAAAAAATPGADDPYTRGDAAALRSALYESLGAHPWCREVTALLPRAGLRFIETKHFVIGSSLPAVPMPKVSKTRRRLSKELDRVRIRIPSVPARPRELDPWLQLHLYAHRLEDLYDGFLGLVGALETSFPQKGRSSGTSMGRGPHLGMQGKFRVLLLDKTSDLHRYFRALRSEATTALHFHHVFQSADALLYAACGDLESRAPDPAHALRCQVLFHVTQDLLRGYRHYDFDLPPWIEEGVGNVLVRGYDPEFCSFSGITAAGARTARTVRWANACFRLVGNKQATPARELCAMKRAAAFDLNHHICSWSRIEFLRTLDEGRKLGSFLTLLKAPLPAGTAHDARLDAVLAAQQRAFDKALGMSFAGFDEEWSRYVQRHYRRRMH